MGLSPRWCASWWTVGLCMRRAPGYGTSHRRRPERPGSTYGARFRKPGHFGARFGSESGMDRARGARSRAGGRVTVSVRDVRDRAMDGQDGARTGSRAGRMGTSVRRCCKYLSHPTVACRSVSAERNRESLPGHPLRTRFVLADGVGTVRTLALSRAAVPFERSGTSWRAPVSISRGAGCGSRRPVA